MMDDADKAQAQNEQLQRHMLTHSRRAAPQPTGFCLYCKEPVEKGRLFCDNKTDDDRGCHGDWEYEQAVLARQTHQTPFYGGAGTVNPRPTGGQ